MLLDDRLLTIRPRRDDIDWHTRQFLDTTQVILRLAGQFFIAGYANSRFLPARPFLVHRPAFGKPVNQHRNPRDRFSIYLIADTNLDGLELIEHIEFGYTQS